MRNECEQIAYRLFQAISQIVLRILIRHLVPVAPTFTRELDFAAWRQVVHSATVEDVPFALRVATQSSFPSCPEDLCEEAKNLTDLIYATADSQNMSHNNYMGEKCPACSSDIRLESGALATCTKGHSWGNVVGPRP